MRHRMTDEKWIPSSSFASPLHVNQTLHHNRATTAANPPMIPAPRPATIVGAAFGVEVVPEAVVLALFAAIEAEDVMVEPLLVIVAAAVLDVAVEAQETAVGRPVT